MIVRSGFEEMKASPWEKEDAMHEGIPIINFHVPKAFVHENGKLTGMTFEIVRAEYDAKGRRSLVPTGEPDVVLPVRRCAGGGGQENAFPWIERDMRHRVRPVGMPVLDAETHSSPPCPTCSSAATPRSGPRTSSPPSPTARGGGVDRPFLHGEDVRQRPARMSNLVSQKMGIHEWSYDNDRSNDQRFKVPWAKAEKALASIKVEVELGFDAAHRVQGGRTLPELRRADGVHRRAVHRVRRLRRHLPDGLHHLHRQRRRGRPARRLNAPAPNLDQDLYVAGGSKTGA